MIIMLLLLHSMPVDFDMKTVAADDKIEHK